MLVSQAQSVQKQLEALKKLEEDEKTRKDMEATYGELQQLSAILRPLVALYHLIHHRLDAEKNTYLAAQVRQIDGRIETSQREFSQQRRQVKPLQENKRQVEELGRDVEAAWKIYAEDQVNPLVELLKLVRRLPEVKVQLGKLDSQKQYLEQFTDRSPKNQQELAEFDQKLQLLSKQLSALNLETEIRDFLDSVLKNEATLADLSDEILTWCRQGDRARIFKITFR